MTISTSYNAAARSVIPSLLGRARSTCSDFLDILGCKLGKPVRRIIRDAGHGSEATCSESFKVEQRCGTLHLEPCGELRKVISPPASDVVLIKALEPLCQFRENQWVVGVECRTGIWVVVR
jgi:hypothetical protein